MHSVNYSYSGKSRIISKTFRGPFEERQDHFSILLPGLLFSPSITEITETICTLQAWIAYLKFSPKSNNFSWNLKFQWIDLRVLTNFKKSSLSTSWLSKIGIYKQLYLKHTERLLLKEECYPPLALLASFSKSTCVLI